MQNITVDEITRSLQRLSPEKLLVVYDFVTYIADRESPFLSPSDGADPVECMLASEAVLREAWDRPEEDAAWSHL